MEEQAVEWVWSRNNCFGDIFEEEEEFDDDCNDDKDEEVDDCNDDDEDGNEEDEEFDDQWGEIILERHLLGQTCQTVKESQFNTGDDIVVDVDDDDDDDYGDDYQSRTPGQALLRTLHMVRQADKSRK